MTSSTIVQTIKSADFIKVVILMIVIVFIAIPNKILAQSKIELIGANSLEFDKRRGEDVKRLIGNVSFRQGSTIMYCDSAYLYSGSNNVEAYGHIHIVTGGVDIKSDKLTYNGNTKQAQLNNKVVLIDHSMTLTTDHLNYNTSSHLANYWTGGKIVDGDNTLTSTIGDYYSDKSEFLFKRRVKLVNPEYTLTSDTMLYNTETETSFFNGPTKIISTANTIYCEKGWYNSQNQNAEFTKNAWYTNKEQTIKGDSLFFNRATGSGKACSHVSMVDSLQKTLITGDYATYNEKTRRTLITGHACLAQEVNYDTLFMHADTLRAVFDSTQTHKTMFAYNKVKFYKKDLQGTSDSLVYAFSDSTITLFKQPVLWTKSNQLTGDTICITMGDKEMKKMVLLNSSFIATMEDSLQDTIANIDSVRFNQVKGKNMVGYFTNGELTKITVIGNGETIYFVREEKGDIIGVNKAEATSLNIHIQDQRIEKIVFVSSPTAVLYPLNQLTAKDLVLKDFKWVRDKRPYNKEDIFKW